MRRSRRMRGGSLAVFATAGLVAGCGDNFQPTPPSADVAELCARPRTGVDPITGAAYPDQPGSIDDEKTWVRAWIHDFYLWYREVPSRSSFDYATPIEYFAVLKTSRTTASGSAKDRFHFTYPTDAWRSLAVTGVEVGYGARFDVQSYFLPRKVVVAYTEPGSPAEPVLARGDEIVAVDGVDVHQSHDVAALDAGLFPAASGETHSLSVLAAGASSPRTVSLTSADIQSHPVQHVTTLEGGAVGYLLFNDHLMTAEAELVAAIDQLKTAGVSDLVLDLRYNGGGLLAIASELAYMIAGPTTTTNRAFYVQQFNDKYPTTNPFTGDPLEPMPFFDQSVFQSMPSPLPHLDLPRVFVLTSWDTCSASEAIINGLMGVGVTVIQIGSTTCGKPYGFYPQDNCGTTFFAIQFHGVNDRGFGDYADGFSPYDTTGATLSGCYAPDDFMHELGDPAETQLSVALRFRTTRQCFASSAVRGAPATAGHVVKPVWLQNQIDGLSR